MTFMFIAHRHSSFKFNVFVVFSFWTLCECYFKQWTYILKYNNKFEYQASIINFDEGRTCFSHRKYSFLGFVQGWFLDQRQLF